MNFLTMKTTFIYIQCNDSLVLSVSDICEVSFNSDTSLNTPANNSSSQCEVAQEIEIHTDTTVSAETNEKETNVLPDSLHSYANDFDINISKRQSRKRECNIME